MKSFSIKIADTAIKITPVYSQIFEMCRDYLTDEEPLFEVETNEKDFEREKAMADGEYRLSYLETLAVYRKIVTRLVFSDILLVHGSAIAVDGKAYLFTAPSGTGKSTHTRMWREYFKERAVMVNDDKPLVRFKDEGVFIYGTPWNGKHRLGNNICAPLKGVCILERAKENSISRISKKEAYPTLLSQIYRPIENGEAMIKTLQLADKFMELPLYRLGCNISQDAAITAYEGMKGE